MPISAGCLRGSYVGCAMMVVPLSFTRVEGAALAALFAVHRAAVIGAERRLPSKRELAGAAFFVAAYGSYFVWHWWYFRAGFPNSYLMTSTALNAGAAVLGPTIQRGWR